MTAAEVSALDAQSPPVAPAESVASPPAPATPQKANPFWYYCIFAASGFAGLIYESIWARYLKLFLGHAAYAQALVLAFFLLGLALGAAVCARLSSRIARPLLWYVIVEIVVAIIAVYFHEIFVAAQNWGIDFVLPRMESDATAEFFKWALGAALIFPQSFLLGTTFPLMSAGVIRLRPQAPGRIVSMLYFSNSIGAAAGVLASGFVLLPLAGLSGTIAIAGLVNAVAAFAVWALGHRHDDTGAAMESAPLPPANIAASASSRPRQLRNVILAAAFVTGAASFIYEIVWVRILSLLLGSSVHTFEIMLSAFIFGLAIGGLAARRWVDQKSEPLVLLGGIQLAMGAFALWSLFAFPIFYDFLNDALREIPRDDAGWRRFVGMGLGLSFAMMLPATICAGMTLPLLTRRLLADGGESAIGNVYAANTAGAIVGVAVALLVLLPRAGAQSALLIGALLDMGLGVVLFGFVARRNVLLGFSLSFVALATAFLFGGIDSRIAAAGVFRYTSDHLPTVVFYQDGKTSSVAVTQDADKNGIVRGIRTNGKADASLYQTPIADGMPITSDEMTMVMSGLLPLLRKPDAKTAMNIGFGSGLTSRTLLLSPTLRRLDNVEIEEQMIAGAKNLGPRVAPVFADPRNKIIINDAKTVLARAGQKYDIIISEPSNPWVSGVAGLFTKEFYARVRAGLSPDGIFAQWLPLYEFNPQLASSVIQALASVFGDFRVYLSASNDMIFIATAADKLPPPNRAIFAHDEARAFLGAYGFDDAADVDILSLGTKQTLMPYFLSFHAPANSDYRPYLENRAPRAFFQRTVYSLGQIPLLPTPVLEALGEASYSIAANESVAHSPNVAHSAIMKKVAAAQLLHAGRDNPDSVLRRFLIDMRKTDCPTNKGADSQYLEHLSTLILRLMPFTEKEKMADIWRLLEGDECMATLLAANDNIAGSYARFWRALSLRDAEAVIANADVLLSAVNLSAPSGQILLLSLMAANYQVGDYARVTLLLHELPLVEPTVHHAARILAANAAEKL